MKQKYLSILVIAITFVLCIGMLFFQKDKDTEYKFVNIKSSTEIDKQSLDNLFNKISNMQDALSKEGNINDYKKLDKETEIKNSKSSEINEVISQVVKEDKQNSTNNEISKSNKKMIDTSLLFKVDKHDILEEMSFKEKARLMQVATKLSMQDCTIILNSIKNDTEITCIKKINTLLKKRLNKEDYEEVEEIIDKYINLDYIKNEIVNNKEKNYKK